MVALPSMQNIIAFPEKQKSNEWYTPSYIIEAARKVLGTIDLDPASCEQANQVVRATRFYTKEDNGLAQDWSGNVWLNPPYSSIKSTKGLGGGKLRGPTRLFIAKLLNDFEDGNVSQAIACVNADTNRAWFQALWKYIFCFASRPVHFYKPDDEGLLQKDSRNCSFFGTAFVYLGNNDAAFIREFSTFGHIAKSIAGPRRETVQATSLWGGGR